MKTYLGIDIGRKTSHFYAANEKGVKIRSGVIDNSPVLFAELAKELAGRGKLFVAMETGNLSFLLARALIETGADVFLVDTLQNALIKESTKKTDKLDAKLLCEQRRLNMLPEHPVYLPTTDEEQLRQLIEARGKLVTERTRISNFVLRLADKHGSPVRSRGLTNGNGWEALLADAERWSLPDLTLVRHAYEKWKQAKAQQREIELLIEARREASFPWQSDLLETIPGVGPVVSATFLARVGTAKRFKTASQVGRYAGLAPGIRQSGKNKGAMGITKSGNHRLRAAAVQAALVISGKHDENDPLYRWYVKTKERRGWQKARIALARRLLGIMYGVLKSGEPYDPQRLIEAR